eukprot:UN04222
MDHHSNKGKNKEINQWKRAMLICQIKTKRSTNQHKKKRWGLYKGQIGNHNRLQSLRLITTRLWYDHMLMVRINRIDITSIRVSYKQRTITFNFHQILIKNYQDKTL